MQEINWGVFAAKFDKHEQATFQWLCYLLFCLEFNQPLGIKRYENHAGLETSPIRVGDEVIGWQAKFYTTSLSAHTEELKGAITTSKQRHPELTKIIFYLNRDFGQHKHKTDPDYKLAIEAHAKDKGVQVEWRLRSFFESPFVTIEHAKIAKFFFANDKSMFDLVQELKKHSENLLSSIHSSISFEGKEIKINRADVGLKLNQALATNVPVILSGDGGTGKTAVIKDLYDSLGEKTPIFMLRAAEFIGISDTKELFRNYGDFKVSDLAEAYPDVDLKIIIVDSAEKLSDIEGLDIFSQFVTVLIGNGWRFIFTTRRAYIDDLKRLLLGEYHLGFRAVDMVNLEDQELEALSKDFGFELPSNGRIKELIQNPFYLNEYLQGYSDIKRDVTYSGFKRALWDRQIKRSSYTENGTHVKREEAFLGLATKRANEDRHFLSPNGLDIAILQRLVNDEIIGYESNRGSYFIAHDIYDEWALGMIIDRAFARQANLVEFYSEIGSSLAIRRAFRQWLLEKLYVDKNAIEDLITNTISDTNLEPHWKDEVLVAVLLSDHAGEFLDVLKGQLLQKDGDLLLKVTFLLRMTCKEMDEGILRSFGIPKSHQSILRTVFTMPKGSGWSYVIAFINDHKSSLGLTNWGSIIPMLDDWASKHKDGETTKAAGQLALFYYEEATKHGGISYRQRDFESKLISTILKCSAEIKDELAGVVDLIIGGEEFNHRHQYHALAKAMLSSVIDSSQVANAIPLKILQLANRVWIQGASESNFYSGVDLDQYFGLAADHHDHYPASAFQTPILTLLNVASQETLEFIVTIINVAVDAYAESRLSENEVRKINLIIDGESREQLISSRLWEMYRGTHVAPDLLASIHMALEKWLLGRAKLSTKEDLERTCLYLLNNSRSASVTAVVASVALAEPAKMFDIAAILFRTKELFLYDSTRRMKDQNHKSSLEMLENAYPDRDVIKKFYKDERIKACDDAHRKMALEQLAFSYQLYKFENEPEAEAERRQKVLWAIFDEYYGQLPPTSKETSADKTWRLFLARMDRRKMKASVQEEEDGRTSISFDPTIDPELKQYSEELLRKSSEALQYTPLSVWASYRWKREKEKYEHYDAYEKDPKSTLQDAKRILEKLGRKKGDMDMLDRSTPAYVCAVLVRDFSEKLSSEEKVFCADIVLNYASLPLQNEYSYQVGDGIEAAIGALPFILGIRKEQDSDIKLLLLFLLFDSHAAGMSLSVGDFALMAILHSLWDISFDDANSLLLGYLLLKPKYDATFESIRSENHKKKIYSVSIEQLIEAFESAFESDLKKIAARKIHYQDAGKVESLDLGILKTAFELIPLNSKAEDHKRFLTAALPLFSARLFTDDRSEEHLNTHRFLEKFAYFVLMADAVDIDAYMQPFVRDLRASSFAGDMLREFVSTQDRAARYDEFWQVWNMLYDAVLDLCHKRSDRSYTKTIIYNYLFAIEWKDTAKEWHTLKDREKSFFKKVANDMGEHPAVLYAIAKLLNDVGSSFLEDGIAWVSGMIEKNKDLSSAELEVNTVYYLENLTRQFVLINRRKIKETPVIKKQVLVILDFLIQRGSVVAYMTRENIL